MKNVTGENIVNNTIGELISEYRKSIIQSEAEVRSKLIVPLLELLEYPSYLRAEEFPVYGFEGGKKLPAKNADYILFSDNQFSHHRTFTETNINWVREHSLLIVEAKKPEEMPEIMGQPEYYTVWTRAVGYLAIDGIYVKGYYYNNISADYKVIDCTIEDLAWSEDIWKFSYKNILLIKGKRIGEIEQLAYLKRQNLGILEVNAKQDGLKLVETNTLKSLSEEDLNDFPEKSLQFMREALGKNAVGLNKIQLFARFLNTTEALLQNDLRYDIPSYIFYFPRKIYRARIYINNMVFPIENGEVMEFYWSDYERFIFESKYIIIDIIYRNNELLNFEIGFHILDKQVSERIDNFIRVKQVLNANVVKVVLDDFQYRIFELPSGNPGKMWISKEHILSMCDFWRKGLEQMKVIEEFYEIEFKLHFVEGEENLNALYEAISFVYDGIVLNENCKIELRGGIIEEDFDIEEPMTLDVDKEIPLGKKYIQDVCFLPYKSWILPGTVHMKGTKKEDFVLVPGCCRCKIVNNE